MNQLIQIFNKPMAMALQPLRELAALYTQMKATTPAPEARFDDSEKAVTDGVQVIRMHGVIVPRAPEFSYFFQRVGCNRVARQLRDALGNDRVSRIVLDIDSPGGDVMGVVELANEIYAARGQKPITAVANGMMASAAYWIGSAADEIVITPSGVAGSIGVVAVHLDHSKQLAEIGIKPTLVYAGDYKVEGNSYEPLGDEAQAEIQRSVDRYHKMFIAAVAKHRGVNRSVVLNDFGQGRVMGAKEAVQAGMVDRVGTIDDVIYSTKRGRRRSSRADISTRQRRLRLAEIA